MSSLPPLPPPLPTAARPQPPAKPKNNGCLIAAVVGLIAFIALFGVLAAIAVPAYQQYVLRSKVMTAIAATRPAQAAIDKRLAQGGECPGNADTDFNGMQGVERVEIGQLAEDATRCVYAIHLGKTGSDQLDGRTIWMDRAKTGGEWNCRSDLDNRYLPPACRED